MNKSSSSSIVVENTSYLNILLDVVTVSILLFYAFNPKYYINEKEIKYDDIFRFSFR